jgi:hypothetical protein
MARMQKLSSTVTRRCMWWMGVPAGTGPWLLS